MKRGKISDVEKFYVQNNQNKSVKELAKTLDRSESVVQKLLGELSSLAPTPAGGTPANPEPFDQNLVNPTRKEVQEDNRIREQDAKDAMTKIYKGVNIEQARRRQRIRRDGKTVGTIMTEEVSGRMDNVLKPSAETMLPPGAVHRPYKDID